MTTIWQNIYHQFRLYNCIKSCSDVFWDLIERSTFHRFSGGMIGNNTEVILVKYSPNIKEYFQFDMIINT